MTQMRQKNHRRCGSKDESDEDPTKTISIQYWDRSQNFARFKMPDGNTTVILQGKNVLKLNRLLLKIRI
jgi:hypothetical protein